MRQTLSSVSDRPATHRSDEKEEVALKRYPTGNSGRWKDGAVADKPGDDL